MPAAIGVGVSLALAVGSRPSYLLTAVSLLTVLFLGILRNHSGDTRLRQMGIFALSVVLVAVGLGLLLAYNYDRFGSFLDFGLRNPASIFRSYYLQGNYFRYDHVPFNIWSYFFQLPQLVPHFPFLTLPFYLREVHQVIGEPYYLLHANELAASAFVLMPVLLFGLAPLVPGVRLENDFDRAAYGILLVMAAFQLTPLLFTVASIARYYHEFLPLLIMIAFLGMRHLTEAGQLRRGISVAVLVLSILLSASVVANGVVMYESYIRYRSPVLDIW